MIGPTLAPIAVKSASGTPFDAWMAVVTIVCVGGVAVLTRGMVQRLLILVGLAIACVIYAVLANGMGLGKPIATAAEAAPPRLGAPRFELPVFEAGRRDHAGRTGRGDPRRREPRPPEGGRRDDRAQLDPLIGRAFVGDGVATMLTGGVGGTGVTTYAENIGVMAVTKLYSTLVFVVAALMAILLGFSPKFGALIQAIPAAVLGGVSIVVFGLIAVAGARIWVDNRVDFADNHNQIVVAVTLVLGAGDFALTLAGITLGGIGTATFGAILLNLAPGPRRR